MNGGESPCFTRATPATSGEVVTNGGRVFAITPFGRDIASARALSYAMADKIRYEGKYHTAPTSDWTCLESTERGPPARRPAFTLHPSKKPLADREWLFQFIGNDGINPSVQARICTCSGTTSR